MYGARRGVSNNFRELRFFQFLWSGGEENRPFLYPYIDKSTAEQFRELTEWSLWSHAGIQNHQTLWKLLVTEASQSIDEEEMHFMLQHSYGLANIPWCRTRNTVYHWPPLVMIAPDFLEQGLRNGHVIQERRSSAETVHFCRASPSRRTRSVSWPGLWPRKDGTGPFFKK